MDEGKIPNNEQVIITQEDREKVAETVEQAIKNLGKPMRYKSFVMNEIMWRDSLAGSIGEEKARKLMEEIKEKAREIRSQIPEEEKPKRYKTVVMNEFRKQDEAKKIEEIRKNILEGGGDEK